MSAQPAGRSGPRIVEDLLRYIPITRHMALCPVDSGRSTSVRPLNTIVYSDPALVPYYSDSLDGARRVFYLIFANTLYHLELQIAHTGQSIPASDRFGDFHLIEEPPSDPETYRFICGVTGREITIIVRPPEFTKQDLEDFEQSRIDARFELIKSQKPTASRPTPYQCFSSLYRIIGDALTSEEHREISIHNPTLNMHLNAEILYKLHFTQDLETERYVPPDLHDLSDLKTAHLRQKLSRMLLEAAVRGLQSPAGSHRTFINCRLEDAVPVILRSLACQDYQSVYPRTQLTSDQYAQYVALGAVETFSDDLILHRYHLQSFNDPSSAHIYVEALKNVAQLRQSEFLEIKVMELLSLGAVTKSDVKDAYSQFSLNESDELNEDLLVDTFKQMVKDRPSSRAGLRKSLAIIANTHKSDNLKRFLCMEEMDLAEAYRVLDTSEIATDEAVRVSYDLKTVELGEVQEDLAKQALLTIAKERGSFELFDYYESQTFGTVQEMDLDSACGLIGVDKSMDEYSMLAIFEIRLKDNPGEILELRQALRTIGNSAQSRLIPGFLKTGVKELAESHYIIWPVGLNNIGNTCYLNSLLQYYFTITPLRTAVLGFIESCQDSVSTDLVHKKVGGRHVPDWEAKRAQEFVKLLAELFNELIHTGQKSVSPTKDLAYLALVPARDEPPEPPKPELELNTEPEPNPEVIVIDSDLSGADTDIEDVSAGRGEDNLIDLNTPDTPSRDSDDMIDVDYNKENEKPKRDNSSEMLRDSKRRVSECAVPEAVPADTDNTMIKAEEPVETDDGGELEVVTEKPAETVAIVSVQEKNRRIDYALVERQQDVTECIENVLFQLEAAFEPTGFEEDGEQLDLIKELFYGKTKQVLESADGSNRREKTERFSSLLVDVAAGPRDIYEAFDSYFGEEALEDGHTRRSVTISELPPILQVQIQRVQFDRILNQPFKSLALLKFDEVIYMDRYLDTGDPEVINKRREVWSWRVEIGALKRKLEEINSRQVSGPNKPPMSCNLS
jgi:ubiquitin carboxyl-terminal hydrolase 25/28